MRHPRWQFNIGHLCTRRQCDLGRAEKVAMRYLSPASGRTGITFGELERDTNRFADVLGSLGFSPGDILFLFLPKIPSTYVAFLGALKMQVVAAPLFSTFGEQALLDRLSDARPKGIVTRRSLLRKVLAVRDRLPTLRHILVVDGEDRPEDGVLDLRPLMERASGRFDVPPTGADAPSVLHYTSGSTGRPKGVLHVHGSVRSQARTAREVLGLRRDDVYWCTADPGWVTGTSYGIIGPWTLGVTQVHYAGGYDPVRWMAILAEEGVTVWYTAPTALRMLMREDPSIPGGRDLSRLRAVFSVGEPLNPEIGRWGRAVLGREIHDTWFQTETGAIMIANRPGLPVRPGSMGKPVAGVVPAIVSDDGKELPDGECGNLCLRPGWPSMFVAYLHREDAYRERFRSGYYFTGDTAVRDPDGCYRFLGRSDDVINTAGHLVSPFEVESALLEAGEVAESGVIGAPDDLLFEKVVAYVRLRDGCAWTPQLELSLRLRVANRVSSIAAPQEIRVTGVIPKNASGKILRRVLKAAYLGADAGDISTMEV